MDGVGVVNAVANWLLAAANSSSADRVDDDRRW